MSKQRKKLDIHGIGFVSWMAFVLFGVFIIGFLWITQVVFLQVYVNKTKESEFSTVSAQLVQEYSLNPDAYAKAFDRIANQSGYTIDILHINDKSATVVYSSSGYRFGHETDDARPFALDSSTLSVANEAHGNKGYYLKDDEAKQLMYGIYLDEADSTLLVVSQSTTLLEATSRILRVQMVIATVVIIVLSFCVSFLLSSAFSQDLQRLSDTAQQLSRDDYSVHFDEKGFSEAKKLASTLNYATAEIRKTEQLRRELISNVSHDLRTPLTIIKGYAEMIRDISGEDAVKREEQLDIIIKEADRLSTLVNDILQLSRVQNQNTPLVTAVFDMAQTISRVQKSFELMALRDGYNIEVIATAGCFVNGNEQQLELVIYNLVGNAINYTGADKRIFVSLDVEDSRVVFRVRDTGEGMDAEQLQHIWQRYYRASEHKRSVVGTGLGLSIVQTILSRHNAQFGVDSTVGGGSTFWFSLPLATPTQGK